MACCRSRGDGERHVIAVEELAAVRRDIAGFPARQRAALILAVEGELSTAEIAVVVGSSRGEAEQLIIRARRSLREKRRARDRRGGN
ncbi:RNA polymerase sigma factor [Jannaschia aquimarina]|uniref:RNA polymerase sigma factor n=1 Tax=Jannaschia aquimarina TaxID=935700 RepID=UPI0011324AA0